MLVAIPTRWRRAAGTAAVLLAMAGVPLAAQVPDSAKQPTAADTARVHRADQRARDHLYANAATIRWYHAAAVIGGVALLTAIDQPVQRYTQRHRSKTASDLAKAFRHEGEPIFYGGISLGVLGVGIVTGNADVQRAGGRLVATVGASAVLMESFKMLIGRSRPNENVGAFKFHPFSSLKDSAGIQTRGSMPSGHTTAAFAVATSLADDIHGTLAHVALYTLAAGTGFSRVYENRHWVSDVAAGAALGIVTAKLVSGRWRIFHLRPPSFLLTPTGAPTLSWRATF